MFDRVRADILRYSRSSRPDIAGAAYLLWRYLGLQALVVHRLDRWSRRVGGSPLWRRALLLRPVCRMLADYVRLAYDIHLDETAEIGPGLYIGHFGGIRLRNCRLGANCAISQEVRIEPAANGSNGPVIGNRVWIGSHARIEGALRVGDGATIAAGAVVTRDVAPGCLVMGNPARVVQKDYDNSGFL